MNRSKTRGSHRFHGARHCSHTAASERERHRSRRIMVAATSDGVEGAIVRENTSGVAIVGSMRTREMYGILRTGMPFSAITL
jgi:hypothetical protein